MAIFLRSFMVLAVALLWGNVPVRPIHAQDFSEDHAKIYVLGPEDVLGIIVYGETDLSGSYKIGPGGMISVPLIGEVPVGGLTPRAAEELIASKFADGYLVDPSVSIQVAEARPFFIMGEVKNPGSYKYISNMTALSAVAMAGGFTYRAKQDNVKIMRSGKEEKIPAGDKILPGDVITIDERFF
jgi:polysaccharide export outer membrane protein